MNYFEFYNIPISFKVDASTLKRTFYKKSKDYHPDFFTLESEEKQAEVLELSTLNNEAYQTLTDFDTRMKYVLDLKGVLEEEGKNSIPQEFLMEMMEINEGIMELEFDFEETTYQNTKKSVEALDNQLLKSVQSIVEHYDDTADNEADLNKMKLFFKKRRYLLRIFKNLSKFASA
ncbi:MAG: molecular chaperone HscB [Paraglaciecola sp.]|jgi:molecular chaperone HscB